jgi:mannitol/fructose-specific phosphotransferase system IIA component
MNEPSDTPNLADLKRVSCTRGGHFFGEAALLNRRSFLHSSIFSGLGFSGLVAADPAVPSPPSQLPDSELALAEYERTIASLSSLDLLGRPRSWSLVRQGLHPISPERVVVVTERGGDGWASRDRKREARLWERLAYLGLRAGKFDQILGLMQVVTSHYQAPHLFETWATGLARREALGSTGMGYGFGLLHQYQDDGDVRLVNAPVDWWMVLFPKGVDWGAFDGESVYAMLGHVFPSYHARLPALRLMAYELTSRVGLAVARIGQDFDPTAWRRIAAMDRISAARTVNMAIVRCVAESA